MTLLKRINDFQITWFNHFHFMFLSLLTALIIFLMIAFIGNSILILIAKLIRWIWLN